MASATTTKPPRTGHGEIARGVFRLGSPLVNWYLVEQDGRLTAVDTGLPGYGKTLEADLAALGFKLTDVAAVVLTHSDADHTGNAGRLRDAGAEVFVNAADAGTLAKPGPKTGDARPARVLSRAWRPGLLRMMGHMVRAGVARPAKLEGATTFSGGERLEVPGRPLTIATPGHTPGHSALLFEDRRALFTGDGLCTWNPFTGHRGPTMMPAVFNVSNSDCRASLGALEGLDADLILPGHGEPWHGSPASAVARAREVDRG